MKKTITHPVVTVSFTPTGQFLKTFLTLCFITSFCLARAQYVDAGVKGDISGTCFYNSNMFKASMEEAYNFSLSHEVGAHGAIAFAHGCGLELEIMQGTLSEGYHGTFTGIGGFPGDGISYQAGESYESTTQLNVIQIPLLFRYEHDINGKYFEAGLAYQFINSATYSATYNDPYLSINKDVTAQYPDANFLVVAGMGWDKRISRESNFYFNFGFRVSYGLYDLGGVDGHGQDLTGPRSVILYEMPDPYYKRYSTTHLVDFSVNAGIFYRFYPTIMIHKRKVNF